jgi:hypothetical protein
MYDLHQFGEGAIPFDLVVPGRGRGTLRILEREVRAEFRRDPLGIPTSERIYLLEDLAELLDGEVGPDAAIAGKALLGPVMFCSEAILVLHEGASTYVPRTRLWLSRLNSSCGSLHTYPVLRLRHHAYDALAAAPVTFRLPEHLAGAFDRAEVTGEEFARRWQEVIREQECLLRRLGQARSPSALLAIVAEQQGAEWRAAAEAREAARETLRERGQSIAERLRALRELRVAERRARRRRAELERRSGELRHQELATGEPEPRQALRQLIAVIADEIESRRLRRAQLRHEIAELAGDPQVLDARMTIADITLRAERERLALARRALLTRHMELGDRRPTAWWFTVADPSGQWFAEATRRAELYLQDLTGTGSGTVSAHAGGNGS